VFVNENEAATFLGRHLLANRFDFELFTPGNLERECNEELCNFEEAREVFEDTAKTVEFFSYNMPGQPRMKPVLSFIRKPSCSACLCLDINVFSLSNDRGKVALHSVRDRPRRSNASLIIRRLEEVSLQPVALPPEEMCPGLPSYEQAIAKSGPHDAPPPPYPGY
ncbi:TMG4 protein, partial [Amia calva]|nr:TMG4 protein [Amia calva]